MRAAFYKGTRPGLKGQYNRIVRLWERGPYSHCELIFSDGMSASSSFEDGGVRFKRIEFDPARWDFIELPWADEQKARDWFERNKGKAYDLMGNVRFIADPLADGKDKWFCSESLAEALGIEDSWRYGPNALAAVLRSICTLLMQTELPLVAG